MKHSLTGMFCAGVASLCLVTSAEAALVSRLGGQAIYDSSLNITWLADADLAMSNTFGVSGIVSGTMDWNTAQTWIGAMNTANYLGFNDWRLPTTLQPDASCSVQSGGVSSGNNCTGSEMGHLFYNDLGGVAGSDITSVHNNSTYSLFSNIQNYYWSGTEYAPNTAGAWLFYFSNGSQNADYKTNNAYAWAVLPGDIAAVPVPGAVWLFVSGLSGLVAAGRRRRRRR